MHVVKNCKGEVVAYCSRKEDADEIAKSSLDEDDRPYTVEKMQTK